MEASERVFDLSGGRLCLDFANTKSNRYGEHPEDLLVSYEDLVAWSRQTGIVGDDEAARLRAEAERRPIDAAAALAQATTLREAIFRVFEAVTGGRPASAEDLAALNAALAGVLAQSRLVPGDSGYRWAWAGEESALERLIWPVAWSATDLLTSPELSQARECASPTCEWLFMDTSRNRSRRWCDMKTCGNRAKARRHYQRKKEAD